MTMHTTPKRIGLLLLISSCLVPVSRAQLTVSLDPNGIVQSGGQVTGWTDSAGTAQSLSAGTTQPTYIADGTTVGLPVNRPVVQFNGNDALTSGAFLGSDILTATAGSIFMVIKPQSQDVYMAGWQSAGPGNGALATDLTSTLTYIYGNNATGGYIDAPVGTSAWNDGNWHIVSFVRNGSSGEIHVDGASLTLDPAKSTFGSDLTVNTSGSMVLGYSSGFTGAVAEVRVYSGGLSPAEITGIETALGTEYNLAPVPEPSQYAAVFALACLVGAVVIRQRRVRAVA